MKVSQLKCCRGHSDDVRRLLQSLAGLLFSLGCDHFSPGLPGGLGLGSHGSLELLGQPHVLNLHPVHVDAPGVGGLLQAVVHRVGDGLPVREDLREVPGAEDVPQGGGGQQSGGPVVVVIVTDGAQWVGDLNKQTISDELEYFNCERATANVSVMKFVCLVGGDLPEKYFNFVNRSEEISG